MDSKNFLHDIIRHSGSPTKSNITSFIVGLQTDERKVTCIYGDDIFQTAFDATEKEFKQMGRELNLKPVGDSWFNASFKGRIDQFGKIC